MVGQSADFAATFEQEPGTVFARVAKRTGNDHRIGVDVIFHYGASQGVIRKCLPNNVRTHKQQTAIPCHQMTLTPRRCEEYSTRLFSRRAFRVDDRMPDAVQAPSMSNWFETARFGMFIHWGTVSQRGWELSWPLVGGLGALPQGQNVAIADYYATAKTFNPVNSDPRQWARMARRAGMQYAVFTTKHHDGFAMFHTRESDFSIEHAPYGKDIVRGFADAFRAEGMRVGFYFSLCDWHHPDYPAFADSDRPYNGAPGAARRPRRGSDSSRDVRPDARAADQLWQDRSAVVRRRMGAHAGGMESQASSNA